ncbi:hypothetical protein M378DRAFT_164594 [Amanita muscaria Koide BX008]|uniref:Uncharacterized protein n=1 Tax=Amanita muscaria (strain Koide BX008) TaxID=946122 RepID=A0A0C2X2B8_AMAMK|nr:hypothetical protein M378DRAFT_164594 [Amanita muscaria Koide BX008]
MNIAQARLVGLFIRAFLYGIYITILAHCLRWIFYEDEGWKLRRRVNGMMLTITMLVFALTTASFGVWHQIALLVVRGQELGVTKLVNASDGLGRATTLIIDATLVYRCWVVYSMSCSAIYFPLFLLVSNIGLYISSFLYIPEFDARLIVTFYSFNIIINLYTIRKLHSFHRSYLTFELYRQALNSTLNGIALNLILIRVGQHRADGSNK